MASTMIRATALAVGVLRRTSQSTATKTTDGDRVRPVWGSSGVPAAVRDTCRKEAMKAREPRPARTPG